MIDSSPDTELHLLEQLRLGSEDAFTAIYKLYWEKLFFVAFKRLQVADDAKEVVQEVFLTLWQKRNTLQIQSLPLYLSAMTRYAVYRMTANNVRKKDQLKEKSHQAQKSIGALDLDNKQLLDILVQLSNELPEKHRIVFIHHKMLDQPLDEVAQMLGVSVRTAEGYTAKVMEFMRRHRQKLSLSAYILMLH